MDARWGKNMVSSPWKMLKPWWLNSCLTMEHLGEQHMFFFCAVFARNHKDVSEIVIDWHLNHG